MQHSVRFFYLVMISLCSSHLIFAQWVRVNNGLPNSNISVLASGNMKLFALVNGGVYRTIDGGANWTFMGISGSAILVNGATIYDGTGSVLYVTTDEGDNWNSFGAPLSIGCFAVKASTLFAGGSSGIYKTTNNGGAWTLVENTLPSITALFAHNGNLFTGTSGGTTASIYRSTNDGANWTEVNNGLAPPHALYYVYGFAASGGYIFAATFNGAYRTSDDGANWTAIDSGLINGSDTLSVYSFAASGTNLYAGTSKGVFLSTNQGTSWMDVNDDSTAYVTYTVAVSGTEIFAGNTSYGVFKADEAALPVEISSMNIAVTASNVSLYWTTATEMNNYGFEVQRAAVKSQKSESGWRRVGFVAGGGTTHASKEYSFIDKNLSAGEYSYRLKQIDRDGNFTYSQTVEAEVGFAPKVFALEQNYPNPFNPTTTISFSIQVSGLTTLTVYDAVGREVKTLVNENLEAGVYHQKQFDASKVSSGMYFAVLTSNGKQTMRKMLLVK